MARDMHLNKVDLPDAEDGIAIYAVGATFRLGTIGLLRSCIYLRLPVEVLKWMPFRLVTLVYCCN